MDGWSAESITDDVYRTKFLNVPDIIAEWTEPHGGLSGRDILDFGCGEATMAMGVALRHGAKRVVAVEIHDEIDNCLPYAKAQLGLEIPPPNLELRKVSAESDLSDFGMFDVIYSWSVFEHVSQELITDCLIKMRKILRPNGVMFLQTTPLYYSAWGSHFGPWIPAPWAHLSMQQDRLYSALREKTESQEQADHLQWVYETLNRVTAPQLLEAAQEAGFEILREYKTYDEIDIPAELMGIYQEDALRTAQLVFLATPST